MDFLSALDISTSGLIVQRFRMNVASENLANVESTRAANGGPYRRKQVIISEVGDYGTFLDILTGRQSASPVLSGMRVLALAEDQTPFRSIRRPGHPDADKDGYVLMPNVNPVLEMADIMSATRAYEANINAFSAARSMVAKALELAK